VGKNNVKENNKNNTESLEADVANCKSYNGVKLINVINRPIGLRLQFLHWDDWQWLLLYLARWGRCRRLSMFVKQRRQAWCHSFLWADLLTYLFTYFLTYILACCSV